MIDEGTQGPATTIHGEEDENYFISMTDMMVGVLFIFIILLMVFALNFRQQTDTSEERIKRLEAVERQAEQATENLTQLQQQVRDSVEAIRKANDVRREMLEEIKAALAQKGLEVEISTGSDILRLRDKAVRFALDDPNLSAMARGNVAIVASVLAEILPSYTRESRGSAVTVETLFLEGHTDKQGPELDNWRLSTARAVNTYISLISAEPALESLTNVTGQRVISVSGYGETRPIPSISDDDYDAQRRIDLRFVMKIDNQDNLNEVQALTETMALELNDLTEAVKRARDDAPNGAANVQ
ncbi:MAG: OmpA/MotB domain protein [Devosia sp.]|uniref:OmpA family protein n=1 Tax=Devosia sp. TaxID=1871048 RepID=UPI002624EDD0|nr:OmpA family protein [Devosia sp.]MDB5539552.1 OmpA/MotB domain protein [Devosia sp.]